MKIAVYDTYVTRKDGSEMHFDILVPESMKNLETIYGYGKAYLKEKGQGGQSLTARECNFCHVEVCRSNWKDQIESKGYFILEMEGC